MASQWQCAKCQHNEYEVSQFQATGGGFAKLFDVQNRKFSTVICSRCRYTEIYAVDSSDLDNVIDFLFGG